MKKLWLLGLVFLLFFLIKIGNLGPKISDENLYFYLGHLVAGGAVPYRDFFVANLPGQVLFYGFLIKLFGFNLWLLKLIPLLAAVGSGVLVWKIIKKRQGFAAGLTAVMLFLFSGLTLGATDFAVGVHEAVFFLVLSWYLLLRGKGKAGGVMFFLALLFRQYVLPAGLGLALFDFFSGKGRQARDYLGYSLALFLAVNLGLFSLFGADFIGPVWTYQWLKTNLAVPTEAVGNFVRNDKFLLLLGLGPAFYSIKKIWNDRKILKRLDNKSNQVLAAILAATLAFGCQFLFLYYLKISFLIYYFSLIPFLAVMGSLGLFRYLPKRSRKLGLVLVVSLSILNGWLYFRSLAGKYEFDHVEEIAAVLEKESRKEETIFGAYLETPLLALLSGREINGWEADINNQRYYAGLLAIDEATRLATGSALFLQAVKMNELGEVTGVDPVMVDPQIVVAACRPLRQFPIKQDDGYETLVLWKCQPPD